MSRGVLLLLVIALGPIAQSDEGFGIYPDSQSEYSSRSDAYSKYKRGQRKRLARCRNGYVRKKGYRCTFSRAGGIVFKTRSHERFTQISPSKKEAQWRACSESQKRRGCKIHRCFRVTEKKCKIKKWSFERNEDSEETRRLKAEAIRRVSEGIRRDAEIYALRKCRGKKDQRRCVILWRHR